MEMLEKMIESYEKGINKLKEELLDTPISELEKRKELREEMSKLDCTLDGLKIAKYLLEEEKK